MTVRSRCGQTMPRRFTIAALPCRSLQRFEEALASHESALAANPDQDHAFSSIADCVNRLCDWRRVTEVAAK